MRINLFFKFLFICILLFYSNNIFADIFTAKSVLQQDVQNAVNIAKDGDIVIIPAGSSTWSTRVNIYAGITIQGAGIDKTIITRTGGDVAFYINIGQEYPIKITGFTFNGNNEAMAIEIKNNPKNFLISNNKFEKCRSRAIVVWGYAYGVIANNTFLDNSITDVVVYGDNDAGWARPIVLGGSEYVFIENNEFIYTGEGLEPAHSVASNHGARYVFRYNNIKAVYIKNNFHYSAPLDVHGNFFYGRGTVAYEIYNNTIDSEHSFMGMYIRGATGVIFNNTYIGDFTIFINLTNYRSWATPSGETSGGCPIDGYNPYYCSTDYPCIDQINNLYIWNNKHNETTIQATVENKGYNTSHIQENRDYFHIAKPSYTPYTYPHPLVTANNDPPNRIRIKID